MNSLSYFDLLLDPLAEAFTPDVARKILAARAEPELLEQLEILREKANEGTLSSEEAAAYIEFVEALDILSLVQAQARSTLSRQSS